MCDRMREDDERAVKLKNDSNRNKCVDVNVFLEKCLEVNERDFRKCKQEVNNLKECMNYKEKII
jgi:hypothetical protein